MTAYVVLKQDEVGNWVEWGAGAWRSGSDAIRSLMALAPKDPDGTYVAVPARSWKPQVVEVEQVARVTVKAVDA